VQTGGGQGGQRRHATKVVTGPRGMPEATVARLAGYLQVLSTWQTGGTICSEDLARAAGVNPAKLRRDLSYLGSHGTRGVGYDVATLTDEMTRALGAQQSFRMALVGVGNLGRALAGYSGFRGRGFTLAALFDVDPAKIGRRIDGMVIEPAADLIAVCAARGVSIGVIATPKDAAQQVADVLCAAGVTSILNFAPAVLAVPAGVEVRRVDLGLELQLLAFHEVNRERDRIAVPATAGGSIERDIGGGVMWMAGSES
jgi:redox-sensing transcriptional repressor